jgi:transketolase
MLHKNNIPLEEISKDLRRMIIEISYKTKAHHVGSALSCIDILTALYFKIMDIDSKRLKDNDWFHLSKGHAGLSLYVVLVKLGLFSEKELLEEFLNDGGRFGIHPESYNIPGVEISSGSLGHGLSIAAGVALAAKKDKKNIKAYVLLGDGECNEGMIWEAALFSRQHKLDNLVAIIDYNNLQGLGKNTEVLNLEPLFDKFVSFGWGVKDIDGHNLLEIVETFQKIPFENNKPNLIIANTIKGKGISYFENKLESHYSVLDEKQYKIALEEL